MPSRLGTFLFAQHPGSTDKAGELGKAICSIVADTGNPGQYINELFGVCPECGDVEEVLNYERDHYDVCHEHRVAWHFRSNLFSAWRSESAEVWDKNYDTLDSYHKIDSVDAVYNHTCPYCGNSEEHSEWYCEHIDSANALGNEVAL